MSYGIMSDGNYTEAVLIVPYTQYSIQDYPIVLYTLNSHAKLI